MDKPPSLNPDYWEHAKETRNEYWAKVKAARADFDGPIEEFYKHLENVYGIKLGLVEGYISDEWTVVDEHKYFFFVLKYTK